MIADLSTVETILRAILILLLVWFVVWLLTLKARMPKREKPVTYTVNNPLPKMKP